jgi:hypothetical protein
MVWAPFFEEGRKDAPLFMLALIESICNYFCSLGHPGLRLPWISTELFDFELG